MAPSASFSLPSGIHLETVWSLSAAREQIEEELSVLSQYARSIAQNWNARTSIMQIPPEIMDLVFCELQQSDNLGRPELAACSRTCSSLRSAAQRRLFSTIVIRTIHDAVRVLHLARSHPHLYSLAQALHIPDHLGLQTRDPVSDKLARSVIGQKIPDTLRNPRWTLIPDPLPLELVRPLRQLNRLQMEFDEYDRYGDLILGMDPVLVTPELSQVSHLVVIATDGLNLAKLSTLMSRLPSLKVVQIQRSYFHVDLQGQEEIYPILCYEMCFSVSTDSTLLVPPITLPSSLSLRPSYDAAYSQILGLIGSKLEDLTIENHRGADLLTTTDAVAQCCPNLVEFNLNCGEASFDANLIIDPAKLPRLHTQNFTLRGTERDSNLLSSLVRAAELLVNSNTSRRRVIRLRYSDPCSMCEAGNTMLEPLCTSAASMTDDNAVVRTERDYNIAPLMNSVPASGVRLRIRTQES